MMRGVHSSRRKVAKERFIRCRHLLLGDPLDGFCGEVFGEVIVVSTKVRFYWCGLIVNRWLPVGGLGANDAVEAFKPHAGWPTVKGPCGVLLPCGGQVPLAKTAGGVTILFQYFGNGGGLWWNRAVV